MAMVSSLSDSLRETESSVDPTTSHSRLRPNPCCWITPGPNWGKQCGSPPETAVLGEGRPGGRAVGGDGRKFESRAVRMESERERGGREGM